MMRGYRYGRAKPPTHRNLGLTPSWHVGALAAAAAVALVLGVWSMTQVDPLRIGGAGLIGVLPPAYFVALALSLAGFVASLALRRLVPALLTWQLLVTMVVLNGADPVIHGLPRLEASFRHLGIADTIAQTGQLDPTLDAYFNWPGFFDLLGMLSGATGAKDLMGIATWAPVGINILLLAPLLALARRLTANPRHAWAAVWIFYLASWIGQDYLAPQAYSFVLLLTLVACLLSVFGGWAWPTERNAVLPVACQERQQARRRCSPPRRPGAAPRGRGSAGCGLRADPADHDRFTPAQPLCRDPDPGGNAPDRPSPAALPPGPGRDPAGRMAALCSVNLPAGALRPTVRLAR